MKKLADFGFNEHSLSGEDGVIARIFEEVGTTSKVCVEFGAWDGFHLSNTARLWTGQGWRGVLIEGDRRRFKQLVRNTESYGCTCINAFVGLEGPNRLESLLAAHGVTGPIDLVSIDIDGDDYHVFRTFGGLRPRVVVIEYNPTIPAHLDVWAEPGDRFGCSVGALVRVGRELGYTLVGITGPNCHFVLDELMPHFAAYETRLEAIRLDDFLTYLIVGVNQGRYALTQPSLHGMNRPFRGTLHGAVLAPTRATNLRRRLRKIWGNFRRRGLRGRPAATVPRPPGPEGGGGE